MFFFFGDRVKIRIKNCLYEILNIFKSYFLTLDLCQVSKISTVTSYSLFTDGNSLHGSLYLIDQALILKY